MGRGVSSRLGGLRCFRLHSISFRFENNWLIYYQLGQSVQLGPVEQRQQLEPDFILKQIELSHREWIVINTNLNSVKFAIWMNKLFKNLMGCISGLRGQRWFGLLSSLRCSGVLGILCGFGLIGRLLCDGSSTAVSNSVATDSAVTSSVASAVASAESVSAAMPDSPFFLKTNKQKISADQNLLEKQKSSPWRAHQFYLWAHSANFPKWLWRLILKESTVNLLVKYF